jgi:hypothetical protein
VGDTSKQVHDFNPGIRRSGLFWTLRLPLDDFQADTRTGQARFHARHLAMPDYHDFLNSVSPSPKTRPGHITFDVRWHGGGAHRHVRDARFDFAGDFITGPATIEFHVSDDGTGVVISSLASGQTNGGDPGVGHERNGRYFTP